MRYQEIVNELFTEKVDWTKEYDRFSETLYTFTVGSQNYWTMMSRLPGDEWSVSFDITANDRYDRYNARSYKKTGTGNAALVFSTVIDIIKTFINEKKPQIFNFEAAKNESSRINLYRRMMTVLQPQFSYQSLETSNHTNIIFELVRNDIALANSKSIQEETITELVGVKKFNDMTATEVLDFIRARLGHGPVKILGQGANGAALIVGPNVYKMWLLDSAYTDFVNYCLVNQTNPFLPKFLSGIKKMPAFFIRHEEAPDYVNYIKMEKLREMGSRALNYQFVLNITLDSEDEDELGHVTYMSLGQITAFIDRIQDSEIPVITRFLSTMCAYQGYPYTRDMLPDNLVLFIETLFALKQMSKHRLDLHQGNFMMRGDQLVILDPIANKDDLSMNLSFEKFDNKLWRDEAEGKKAQSSLSSKTTKQNNAKE